MSEELKIGQSLTREQILNLPDGAVFTIKYGYEESPYKITINGVDGAGHKSQFQGYSVDVPERWNDNQWHSAALVSLPSEPQKREIPKPVIDDLVLRSVPSEPSPGEGYRWLVPRVDTILDSDELNIGNNDWISARINAGEVCNVPGIFRRRIEPQVDQYATTETVRCDGCGKQWPEAGHACVAKAEPAPRVASEIEKEAASVFITSSALAMIEWAKKVYECERDVWLSEAIARLDTYRRAESYARSIGAIQ